MIFLGASFYSGNNVMMPPLSPTTLITSIQIFDGVYNHLLVTADVGLTSDQFDIEWDYDMKINANFDDDIEGGNSDFSVKTTDHMVIKRREVGTYNWTTIYVKEVTGVDDFDVHFIDKYARSDTEYEYCVSSYLNGVENAYVIQNVYSEFDGFYITDKDCLYGTIYDVDGCDTSRNIITQTLSLLNSKYITVVSNGETNYDSGTITGTFLTTDESNAYADLPASLQNRTDVKNRLANKKPLILKVDDGRIWMIKVSGGIADSQGNHRDIRQISFSWEEVGDVSDMEALYLNGLSDVDSRWW